MSVPNPIIHDRFGGLHPRYIDLTLDRVSRLLRDLGDPHLRLPPVVHVAGTNGKGSVVAYLKAIGEAAGLKVHAYISPALISFNERIVVAGQQISDTELLPLIDRCGEVNAGQPITVFEMTTAIAFEAFARHPADLLLLEVGVGGRGDATNVIPASALSVITPVDFDHMDFLGDTLDKIATEKAGILRPGVPCVVGPQPPAAAKAIERAARKIGAPLWRRNVEFSAKRTIGGFRWTGDEHAIELPAPSLAGSHQVDNAATAVACARLLGRQMSAITDKAIAAGVTRATWPARLQHLTAGRLVALLPPTIELWLDGGHNPHAARALAETVADWSGGQTALVWGMQKSKDADAFIRPFAHRVAAVRTVGIDGEPNARSAFELAEIASAAEVPARPAETIQAALLELARMPGVRRVLICGSLYLAGRVLTANQDAV
jgi:dihydrofolate synthase/folylpolyglutamate synthase